MRFFGRFVLTGFVALAARAGDTGPAVSAPVLGFVYDSGRSAIRPIRGIPGAALVGDPLDAGFALALAVISPSQEFALAVPRDGSALRLIDLATLSATAVPGAMASPNHMVFSPSGRAALLYASASEQLQIVTGLPGNPAVREVNPDSSASVLSGSAVSDAGDLLLASDQDTRHLSLLASGGNAVDLPVPGPGTVAAFLRDRPDLLAVTRAGDVYLVRNAGSSSDVSELVAGNDQTAGPVAVEASPDGTTAYIATASGTNVQIDLSTGTVNSSFCQCSPTALEPLRSGRIFRLTEINGKPLMLFDASSSSPRTWFVPVGGGVE